MTGESRSPILDWLSPGAYGELRDLFAIGVILYEQATSHHPFAANRNDYDDCEQRIVMRQNVPAAEAGPHLDPAFAEILDRAVARREGDRFESLRALRDALKPFAVPRRSAAARPPVDTRTIAASIADQQAALERLCEPLRAGLYPDVRVITRIANTLPTLTATIHCFEVEGDAVCIEIPLVWDGVNGSWKEQEPGALRDACIERAEAEIEARLHRAVIEASRVFGSHAQLLQLEFDPPQSEGDFPTRCCGRPFCCSSNRAGVKSKHSGESKLSSLSNSPLASSGKPDRLRRPSSKSFGDASSTVPKKLWGSSPAPCPMRKSPQSPNG